jgi:LysR family hydrogen peroxide-inducible transcriptional activator
MAEHRSRQPTLRQLGYFLELVERQHFGRAAEACFVSQSAFSNAIQELEATLGRQLVDRTNRRVTITATGQEIAVQARLCLRDVEALVEMARRDDEPLTGRLRLGVIPTIAPFMLPPLLPELRRRFEKLQLLLVEGQTLEVHERLLRGDLDAILIALPFELSHVEVLPLFREGFRLACRSDTTLVDPENYRFNRLNAESVMLLEDGHCLRDHAMAACRVRNTDTVSRFAATSILTLIEMVDADLGVTFLPEMAEGSALLRQTRVKTFPLKERGYREIALLWRSASGRGEEFRMLGEFLAGFADRKNRRRSATL